MNRPDRQHLLIGLVTALCVSGLTQGCALFDWYHRGKVADLYTQMTVVAFHLEDHFERHGRYPSSLAEVRPTHTCVSPTCRGCTIPFDQAIGPDPWGSSLGYLADGKDYLLWSNGRDRKLDAEWTFNLNGDEAGRIDTVMVTTSAMQWYEGRHGPNFMREKIDRLDAERIGRVLEAQMRRPSQ